VLKFNDVLGLFDPLKCLLLRFTVALQTYRKPSKISI
jgi:hypothetical protein